MITKVISMKIVIWHLEYQTVWGPQLICVYEKQVQQVALKMWQEQQRGFK